MIKNFMRRHLLFCIICERNSQNSTDYMVNGNVPCFSVQWISVCECMNHGSVSMMPHGVVYQHKLRCTDWMRCPSSVLQDAGIGTINTCSVQAVYVDWKCFSQEKCRAFTCQVKMWNAYVMSSGVHLSYYFCDWEPYVHVEPSFNLCEVRWQNTVMYSVMGLSNTLRT
jgi:hypothetical protein